MKKSLSLLVAIAMVFSMFATVVSAEETTLTVQQKYDALVGAGIFEGDEDGKANLDKEMNRAQAAKIVALLTGYKADVSVKDAGYTDLTGYGWASSFINYATEVGVLEGKGNNKFDPGADVTIEQLAKIAVELVKTVGITLPAGEPVEGEVADWAAANVAAAVSAGLIAAQEDYTVAALRAILVDVTYAATEWIEKAHAVTASVTQAAGNKLNVTFNKAVDSAKAVITVKNGNATVNAKSITFAEDKKSAVIEFAANLVAADYTVSVAGLSEEAITATVKVEASKVAKVEFATDKLVIDRSNPLQASVEYKVYDQFNADVTSTTSLQATTSTGTIAAGGVVSNGKIVITNGVAFTVDTKVTITALHVATSTFASTLATVSGPSRINAVQITGLVVAEGKVLEQGATPSDFKVEVVLHDQYGNVINDQSFLTANYAADVHQSVAGTSVTFGAPTVANGKVFIPVSSISATVSGKTQLSLVSLVSGARASLDVDVKEQGKLDVITLTAPAVAAKGSTIEIPFSALNQFGEAIMHVNNGHITLTANGAGAGGTSATATFDRNYVKDTTTLKLTIDATASNVIVLTGITQTQKFVSLQINTVAQAVPTSIAGVKDINALLIGATQTVAASNVIVKDQYGNDIALGAYTVKVAASGSAATTTDVAVPATFNAAAKGSTSVTLTLVDGSSNEVANSSYTFDIKVVDKAAIQSYEATVDGIVKDDATNNYDKALKVVGLLADGSKVSIPNNTNNYVVSINETTVTHTAAGKIHAQAYTGFTASKTEVEIPVIVTVKGVTSQTIVVTVKISNVAPEITTLSVVTSGVATKEDTNYASVAVANLTAANSFATFVKDALKAVDQYGVELTGLDEVYSNIIISGLGTKTINGYDGAAATTVVAGDTFSVTAVTANSKIAEFKVIVK